MEDLLQRYADAAAAHGEATAQGDYKKANANHDLLVKTYREIRARGAESQKTLLELLNHSNDNVKLWAATHALQFEPNAGQPVLEKLARLGGVTGFNAQNVLKEWRSGRLKLL